MLLIITSFTRILHLPGAHSVFLLLCVTVCEPPSLIRVPSLSQTRTAEWILCTGLHTCPVMFTVLECSDHDKKKTLKFFWWALFYCLFRMKTAEEQDKALLLLREVLTYSVPPSLQIPTGGPFLRSRGPWRDLLEVTSVWPCIVEWENTFSYNWNCCHNPVLVNNAHVTKCADERAN